MSQGVKLDLFHITSLPPDNPLPPSTLVVVDMFFLRDEIQLTLDMNPQNCKISLCLGSFLTTRSRRDDDYKDSLRKIPFPSQDTQTRSLEVQTDWLALSQTVIRTKSNAHG